MKKIILSTITSLLIFSLFLTNSLAQKATTTQATTNTKSMLVATVNIYNATNTKVGDTYNISFDLSNREGIQSDIRYGVELINKDNNQIADLDIVNTALTLGENSSKNISLSYTVPNYIPNGIYKLMIISQNASGLPLAIVPAGYPETVVNIDNNKSVSLENCSSLLDGKTFKNNEMVRVDTGKVLNINCEVNNQTSRNNYKIQLISHRQSKFGDIIASQVLDQDLNLKSNSNTSISFNLNTETNPGNYTVDAFLINGSKEKVSGSVYLNYIVNGLTAVIQNSILDKDSYSEGDTAKLQVFWSSLGKDLSIKAEIVDQNNNLCGSLSKDLTNGFSLSDLNLNIPITKDCAQAIAKVSILSGDQVLASSEINTNQDNKNVNINPNLNNSTSLNLNRVYILIFILILVLLAYGILVFKKSVDTHHK